MARFSYSANQLRRTASSMQGTFEAIDTMLTRDKNMVASLNEQLQGPTKAALQETHRGFIEDVTPLLRVVNKAARFCEKIATSQTDAASRHAQNIRNTRG
jgi:uncharacterized protein YukE